jgi:hypothetical protein
MHQLRHLQQCSTGLPPGLRRSIHPLHACPTCDSARPFPPPPLGPTFHRHRPDSRLQIPSRTINAASSNTFLKTKTATRVVQSHDGFTSYLIIADAVPARGVCWRAKNPPFNSVSKFLQEHGLTTGYRAVVSTKVVNFHQARALRHVFFNAGCCPSNLRSKRAER